MRPRSIVATMVRFAFAALAAMLAAAPASAGELFGGLYVHDVKTPLDKSGIESGLDVQLGYRGGRASCTPRFSPMSSARSIPPATPIMPRSGSRPSSVTEIYIRPGLGIAVHTGSASDYYRTDKIAFGSRVLFEPEIGVGARLNDHLSVEASWVHMSHATLFSRENPGIDNLGVRLNLKL